MTEETEVSQDQAEETEEERITRVIKSYVDRWHSDWKLLIIGISEQTGLDRGEAIAYLHCHAIHDVTAAIKTLQNSLHHPELLDQTRKLQDHMLEDLEQGEDWKDGDDE